MTKKKGFTLVELSIVLVIIGLLIGGILAAQSMITTAKVQGVIRQLTQYDIAVTNFQTRYNSVPGDSTTITVMDSNGNQVAGNGNGLVESNETPIAWEQLSAGVGLKNYQGNDFQPWMASGSQPSYTEASCPKFNIDQDKNNPPCLSIVSNYGSTMKPGKNYYMYYEPSGSQNFGLNVGSPLKASDTLAIDLKIDDGMPTTGKMLAQQIGTASLCVIAATLNYNASGSGYACTVFVELNTLSPNN